jgi:hypothetical protein
MAQRRVAQWWVLGKPEALGSILALQQNKNKTPKPQCDLKDRTHPPTVSAFKTQMANRNTGSPPAPSSWSSSLCSQRFLGTCLAAPATCHILSFTTINYIPAFLENGRIPVWVLIINSCLSGQPSLIYESLNNLPCMKQFWPPRIRGVTLSKPCGPPLPGPGRPPPTPNLNS